MGERKEIEVQGVRKREEDALCKERRGEGEKRERERERERNRRYA